MLSRGGLDFRKYYYFKDSFNFISFSSIPLRCNRAALALANIVKKKEEVIVWLEECPSFLFPIVQSDLQQ